MESDNTRGGFDVGKHRKARLGGPSVIDSVLMKEGTHQSQLPSSFSINLLFIEENIFEMVLLTVTTAGKAAVDEYCKLNTAASDGDQGRLEKLSKTELGSPIEHHELIDISKYLVQKHRGRNDAAREWRLETLLKGAAVYQPPPPPKPEPVSHLIPYNSEILQLT